MKPIIIKSDNFAKITAMIDEAEGRATVRTIDYDDIVAACKEVADRLDIPKVHMIDIKIDVDANAQKFPNAYKYVPESTHFTAVYKNGSWRLISVTRKTCRTHRFKLVLPDTARWAIIDRMERF